MLKDLIDKVPKVASFDFDDTISISVYSVPENYEDIDITDKKVSQKIKGVIQELYQLRTQIYLVTSRRDTIKNREHVINFLKQNEIFHYFKDFIFVGDDKSHALNAIKSELHFDDDEYEFKILLKDYPNSAVKFIQIEHSNEVGALRDENTWNFKKLNGLKAFFKNYNLSKELNMLIKLIEE